jgi:hypothetical protein
MGYDQVDSGASGPNVRWWYMDKRGNLYHSRNLVFKDYERPLAGGPDSGEQIQAERVKDYFEPQEEEVTTGRVRKQTERFDPGKNANRPQLGKKDEYEAYYEIEEKYLNLPLNREKLEELVTMGSVTLTEGESIPEDYEIPATIKSALICPKYPQWKTAVCKELCQMMTS